ncbi:alpha/beta hydrolase-fold protein [Pseudoalteromonas sp. OOF1S-7]|uniref:alpha/beta hydrolase n=1 Tax=Pseudoalteromonas sp. OOF1S-7 TaxID=2917757 RepID=UPI001EF61846|nr:alpha/beta hydrolase-fold protein [Pseudoalteromonas sp. OOF1S-7]MCG7534381.1 hypothetical protein [Pseudoalteromonas sp. OOF1S-7]
MQLASDTLAGELIHRRFSSEIYPATTRDYWVYIPNGYHADHASNLMIFQDGYQYINPDKPMNIPAVFDQLIKTGDMPHTIAVFVNPGEVAVQEKPDHHPDTLRSIEYDTVSDQYARFLLTELLPDALSGLNVSQDPKNRAIAGFSSGGICAWTVAWYRSDQFSKVLSHCGSFVDIRGGGVYPYLIRNEHIKPIKVYLQSGENDLDTRYGNWALGNQAMASALKFKGYHYQFAFGQGGHTLEHGSKVLIDSLKWLWHDEHRTASQSAPAPAQ